VYLEALVAYKLLGRSSRTFAIGIIVAFAYLLLTFWITNIYSGLHN